MSRSKGSEKRLHKSIWNEENPWKMLWAAPGEDGLRAAGFKKSKSAHYPSLESPPGPHSEIPGKEPKSLAEQGRDRLGKGLERWIFYFPAGWGSWNPPTDTQVNGLKKNLFKDLCGWKCPGDGEMLLGKGTSWKKMENHGKDSSQIPALWNPMMIPFIFSQATSQSSTP